MNLKITVTAKDIRDGKRRAAFRCPIALACNRLKYPNASVCHSFIRFEFGGKETPTTKKMQDWMGRFDLGKVVKPFFFTVKNAPKPRSL